MNVGFRPISHPIKAAAGSLLQVKQAVKTDMEAFSTPTDAEEVWHPITGLSVTIRPKNRDHQILVRAIIHGASNEVGFLRLAKDGSALILGDDDGSSRIESTGGTLETGGSDTVQSATLEYLDTITKVKDYTYSVDTMIAVAPGTVRINAAQPDTDTVRHGRFISTITVMEIAT